MNVLVTGGAGYIGSHLCKALYEQGYTPIVYDSLKTGHANFVKWGPLIVGDILDEECFLSACTTYTPFAIFHLAADSYTRESPHKASSYYETNVQGTLSILNVLKQIPPAYLIFASSAAVYGSVYDHPIQETRPTLPTSLYGRTKLSCEHAIQDLCPCPYAILRYFNVAGADSDSMIGERHLPETHLIPLLIHVWQKKIPYLSLLGIPHATHDTTAIRDFIHVTDLAKAHLLVLQYLLKHHHSLIMNLGSGIGHTLLEVLHALEAKVKTPISYQRTQTVQEPAVLIGDISKAKQLLSFTPNYSLDDILETALHWHIKA